MKKTMSVAWLRVERMSDLALELLAPVLLVIGGVATILVTTIR